jgi:rod shape-determining protein MreD
MYFSLLYRSPVRGIFIGAGIGLTQDSLSQLPLGMLGIVKTLVGYFAGSVGMRFDVDHPLMRFTLTLFFVLFHQLLFWMLQRSLLGTTAAFEPLGTLLQALLNAIVGVPLFRLLDKLKSRA